MTEREYAENCGTLKVVAIVILSFCALVAGAITAFAANLI
jgi:hypothetical protein